MMAQPTHERTNADCRRLLYNLSCPQPRRLLSHPGDSPPPAAIAQSQRLFLKFFPGESELAESFVTALRSHELDISMAVLQSYFMLHRASAQRAHDNASELCKGVRDAVPVQQHMSEAAAAEGGGQRRGGSDTPPLVTK